MFHKRFGNSRPYIPENLSEEAMEALPGALLEAFGGPANIEHLDCCITRLRVEVKDASVVHYVKLEGLGAAGIQIIGNHFQVVYGLVSELLKSRMQDIMAGRQPEPLQGHLHSMQQDRQLLHEIVVMPMQGELLDLGQVPDPVFSNRMTGDGFGVIPHSGLVVSPVYGRIANVFPTQHAVTILSDGGKEVLVHIGVGTVKLRGQGFELLVEEDELVAAGQPIIQFDLDVIREQARSSVSSVIFMNLPEEVAVMLNKSGELVAGEEDIVTFTWKTR